MSHADNILARTASMKTMLDACFEFVLEALLKTMLDEGVLRIRIKNKDEEK